MDTEPTLDAAGTEGAAAAAGGDHHGEQTPQNTPQNTRTNDFIDLTGEDEPSRSPSRIPETPPTVASTGYEPAYACGICFRSMINKPMAASSECGHVFCAGCLETALRTPHPRCPKCMRNTDALPLYF